MSHIPHPTQAIPIMYEDADMLVLDKPAGLVVNDAESVQGVTLQTAVRDYIVGQFGSDAISDEQSDWESLLPADFTSEYGSPTEIFTQRDGMVHRLDRETSGALLWAKNPGALVSLLSQFQKRTVFKTYLALCHGRFASETGTISLPLGRSQFDRKKMAIDPTGRPAVTGYEVLEFYETLSQEGRKSDRAQQNNRAGITEQGYSLVECHPKTGRTHQLRVHLAQLQHPIVSDQIYGGKRRVKQDKIWCERLFLHAAEITFLHPRTGDTKSVEVPLSQELQGTLAFLKNQASDQSTN